MPRTDVRVHPPEADMRARSDMRHASELLAPVPYSQEDPWWWCRPCADGDHQDHVAHFADFLGDDAACECPHCEA